MSHKIRRRKNERIKDQRAAMKCTESSMMLMLMMTNILEAIIIIIISVVRSFCFLFEFDCVVANIKHKLSKIHVNFEKTLKRSTSFICCSHFGSSSPAVAHNPFIQNWWHPPGVTWYRTSFVRSILEIYSFQWPKSKFNWNVLLDDLKELDFGKCSKWIFLV